MISVVRKEEKYMVSLREAVILKGVLSSVLHCDSHSNGVGHVLSGYYIRSVYFDDTFLSDYFDGESGIADRKKIRIRLYDIYGDMCKLEVKSKYAISGKKESLVLKRNLAESIINGNYSTLLYDDNEVAYAICNMFSRDYSPKVIIDYYREAWEMPVNNVRVTIDYDIKACRSDGLFDKNIIMKPIIDKGKCILEVKYDGELPKIVREILTHFHLYRTSFSKYCTAIELLW